MVSLGYNDAPLFSLVAWGNAWLGYDFELGQIYHQSSSFRSWRETGMVLPGLDGASHAPLDWLKHLKSESRRLGLWHRGDPVLTERIEQGGNWFISVHGASETMLVGEPWGGVPGRVVRLWSGIEVLTPRGVSLADAAGKLREALAQGLDFVQQDHWSGMFRFGLDLLDGDQDVEQLGANIRPRVHFRDLLPAQYFPPEAERLLAASLSCTLPTGMGGWSDYSGPDGTMEGWSRAGQIQAALMEAKVLATLSVLNLHAPRNT